MEEIKLVTFVFFGYVVIMLLLVHFELIYFNIMELLTWKFGFFIEFFWWSRLLRVYESCLRVESTDPSRVYIDSRVWLPWSRPNWTRGL